MGLLEGERLGERARVIKKRPDRASEDVIISRDAEKSLPVLNATCPHAIAIHLR
jgi:hypothetical protein